MIAESDADKLQRRNRELSILNAIAQALNRTVDLDQAIRTVLAQVAELLDLQTGWVWLLHPESGDPYLAAAQNLPPALIVNRHRMEGDCYCLRTYREGDLEGAANTNVIECSRLHGLVDGTDGLLYHASIPLYASEKRLGVMNVASPDWRALSDEELQLLYTVGDLFGIAIERARLFSRSSQLGASEERNRLAREIHDTLAQGLAAVALQLESADAILEADRSQARARQTVQKALDLTRASLEEARRSVMDLRAAPLEGKGLVEALSTLAGSMSLAVEYEVGGVIPPLSPRVEIGIYRVAQEALANAARHSGASLVKIQISATSSGLRLIVEDDGQGFDPDVVPGERFGLLGMNERIKLLNGRLHISGDAKTGTRLEAVVPLTG
jgi:two-component system NarL family sensor kinase